jgi:hypothetical protein
MDYYPYPDKSESSQGPVADIATIAADMRAAAGDHSWFSIQMTSYDAKQPKASWITYMAQLALFGNPPKNNGGVQNLMFYYYPSAERHPGQLEQVKIAVQRIRATPGF